MNTLLNKYLFFSLLLSLTFSMNSFAQQQGKVTIESSEKIKQIVAKKKSYNKNLKEVMGFKIQLFNGSEQGAYKTRDHFLSMFAKTKVKIEFFSPEWKVRVGNYKDRLEADRALAEIKEAFPGAIILATMVEI